MAYLKQKSMQNWEIASVSISRGYYNVAVSRFYYSLYEIAKGFLIEKGIWRPEHDKPHENLIAAIYEYLKKRNIPCDSDTNRTLNNYNELRRQREDADYKNDVNIDKDSFDAFGKEYIKSLMSFLCTHQIISATEKMQMEKHYDCFRA